MVERKQSKPQVREITLVTKLRYGVGGSIRGGTLRLRYRSAQRETRPYSTTELLLNPATIPPTNSQPRISPILTDFFFWFSLRALCVLRGKNKRNPP